MTQKICKGSSESEDVAHYVITEFMQHDRATELVESGEAMKFMSGMIWRSFNSSTSPYHKIYRQKNRMNSLEEWHEPEVEEYDYDQDYIVEAIQCVLEEMEIESVELWYRAKIFRMWLEDQNYSSLARKTQIPRTSISQAVSEAKDYIYKELKERGINYD